MKSAKIAIIDDENMFRDFMRVCLEKIGGIDIVLSSENGNDLFTYLENNPVDIVILDVMMPDINGIAVAEKLKQYYPDVKVIILTAYQDINIVRRLIKTGVLAYLLKSSGLPELREAIDACKKGEQYFCKNIFPIIRKDYKKHISGNIDDNELSERESEVLCLLADGYSAKEISEKLFLSQRTIESHKYSLMKKLDIFNIAGLTKFAIRNGLIKP